MKLQVGRIIANCWITIREVAEEAGISHGSCNTIFTDAFDIRWVTAKFVSKLSDIHKKMHCTKNLWVSEIANDPT